MTSRACSKCKIGKPFSDFQHFKGRPSGQCRACKTASEKARRERAGIPVKNLSRLEDGKKLCLGCDCMLPMNLFSKNPRGLGGVVSYCRPCFKRLHGMTREEGRTATAAYRKRHRERHLANHRITQFERKKQIKVVSDGSVTDAFLKALYAMPNCFYCGEETIPERRTADHRIAIAKGGSHSAGNLVMACWTCNSAKRDTDEQDFLKLLKNDNHSQNHRG